MVNFTRTPIEPRFADLEPRRQAAQAMLVPLNIAYLMELDDDAVIYYRGRAFRVPPVPSTPGAVLYDAIAELSAFVHAAAGDNSAIMSGYTARVQRIITLCTRLIRPTSRRGRLLRMLGLWRPLRAASDGDVKELANFLLERRAKSTIRSMNLGRG